MKKESFLLFFCPLLSASKEQIVENENTEKRESIELTHQPKEEIKPKTKDSFLFRVCILLCFIVVVFFIGLLIYRYRITRQKNRALLDEEKKALLEKQNQAKDKDENQPKDQIKIENIQMLLQLYISFFLENYCAAVNEKTFEFSEKYRLKIKQKPLKEKKKVVYFFQIDKTLIENLDLQKLLEIFSEKTFFFYGLFSTFFYNNDNSFFVKTQSGLDFKTLSLIPKYKTIFELGKKYPLFDCFLKIDRESAYSVIEFLTRAQIKNFQKNLEKIKEFVSADGIDILNPGLMEMVLLSEEESIELLKEEYPKFFKQK